jgi:RNA polymerase sigma-70 factor, ECF subfamily
MRAPADAISAGDDDPRGGSAAPASDSTAMWAEFAGPLRAFLARRVPPGVDADDVLQEVFVRVLRHLPTLRAADRLDAWLFQIARNALMDSLRVRQRRDARTDSLDVDVAAEPPAEDVRAAEAELTPCLVPMVARLEEPYRTAITLTALDGLTQTAAARRMGISVSGMKSRVQRAREQLKRMLLRCCEVDVDTRGGVTDYHVRAGSTSSCALGGQKGGSRRCGSGACATGRE